MATLFVPTPSGGRRPVLAVAGRSVHAAAVDARCADALHRFGAERKEGETWVPVAAGTLLRPEDEVRVRFPAGQVPAGAALLGTLVASLLRGVRRKRR